VSGSVFSRELVKIAIREFTHAPVFPTLIRAARFQIAPVALPAYSNCLMGQQHRVRRSESGTKPIWNGKRLAAKARRRTAKPRGKKAAADEPAS
jgi:hypothetical protein